MPHPRVTNQHHNCWCTNTASIVSEYTKLFMAATVWNKLISDCYQVSFNIKLAENALKLQNPNTRKLKTKWDKESQPSKDILAFPKLGAVTARRCYVVCQSVQCSVVCVEEKGRKPGCAEPCSQLRTRLQKASELPGGLRQQILGEGRDEMRTNPCSPVISNQPNQQKKKKQPTRRPIYRKKRHIARPSRSRWPLFR